MELPGRTQQEFLADVRRDVKDTRARITQRAIIEQRSKSPPAASGIPPVDHALRHRPRAAPLMAECSNRTSCLAVLPVPQTMRPTGTLTLECRRR